MMEKTYDDTNWREEYKGYTNNKRYIELLENGPKSLSQAWLLGALHNEWKKMKWYDKLDPKENKGQCQSSMQEFFQSQKDQGIWHMAAQTVTWSIVIMVAILLVCVTIAIYYIMRYDHFFPND